MRRAGWWGLFVGAMSLLPAPVRAQGLPVPLPPPGVSPSADSVKPTPPTFVADTARHLPVVTAEPTDAVTPRLGLRIGAAIVVLTLSTLLLYNVRSR